MPIAILTVMSKTGNNAIAQNMWSRQLRIRNKTNQIEYLGFNDNLHPTFREHRSLKRPYVAVKNKTKQNNNTNSPLQNTPKIHSIKKDT